MQSTISSSKDQMEDKMTEASLYGEDSENPFKLPSDELIFSFKENEKDRKVIDREKNKQLRIWEKNRPIREGCLRRICETDIEPTQLAINPKVQSKVNVAEAAGFTIPIERPKNRENRWQLIQKKREIGLVQQMLETKQAEIERLAEHATMREDGLTCSENMLETDTHLFINFFNRIKQQTQDASKTLDDTRRTKNEKNNELKSINDQLQILQSGVSKNAEYLEQYSKYKEFLDGLYSKITTKDEALLMLEKEEQKILAIKEIERRQARDGNQKKKSDGGADDEPQGLEAELSIPASLQYLYEDSDEESPERFNDPNDLMEILNNLEEANLTQITRMQQSEEQLEIKKQQKQKQERTQEIKTNDLKRNEQLNMDRIKSGINYTESLTGKDDEDQVVTLGADMEANIVQLSRELFLGTKVETIKPTDPEYAKMQNMTAVDMLIEVEQMINNHLSLFGEYEVENPETIKGFKKKIRQKERLEFQKIQEEDKRRLIENQKDTRIQQDLLRKGKVVGKIPMVRSQPPKVKKIEKIKKKYTEQEQDMIDYGLGLLVEQQQKKGNIPNDKN